MPESGSSISSSSSSSSSKPFLKGLTNAQMLCAIFKEYIAQKLINSHSATLQVYEWMRVPCHANQLQSPATTPQKLLQLINAKLDERY
jgi:hypothetical protein